ncbi:MAG: aromatic amino acid lyase, partial [Paracoccaceae bacterium]
MITLSPGSVSLETLEQVYREGGPVRLDADARPAVEAAAELVAAAAAGGAPVYGVNTGFGKLASRKIAPEDTETLQ